MSRDVPVERLLDVQTPGSKADEVGRDPALDGELEFDHGDHDVTGVCERCRKEVHEGVTGHSCADGFRHHRDGEEITNV